MGSKVFGSLVGFFVGRKAQARLGDDVVAVISNSNVGYHRLRQSSNHCKFIHVYHGTYRGQAEAIRPFISRLGYCYLKWWDSMVLERASGRRKRVLCCSDQVREEVERFFGYSATTCWCPLDTTHFSQRDREESRRLLNLPLGVPVGVFVGSVQPTKGFPVVRHVIEALPELQWVLAVRGDRPKGLEGNPRVRILHNATREVLPHVYSAADFSLVPSRYEAFSYAVAESVACGTPVVASLGGASRFFLGEAPLDRLLVPSPGAKEGFIIAIREVLNNPDTYRQAVSQQVRPKLVEAMATENWWRRFFEVTGL